MMMTLSGWALAVGFACLAILGGEALKFTFKCPPPMEVDASLEKTYPMNTSFRGDPKMIELAGNNFDYILYTTKLRRCGLFEGITQQLGDLVDFGRPINQIEADHMAFMFDMMIQGDDDAETKPVLFYAPENVTFAIVKLLNKYGLAFDEHAHELYADE